MGMANVELDAADAFLLADTAIDFPAPGSGDKRAFVTGSRSYGKPRNESDIDLVVWCERETALALATILGDPGEDYGEGSVQVKVGDRDGDQPILNLILVSDRKVWLAWQRGTAQLRDSRPATRDVAIRLLKAMGVNGKVGER